MKVFNHASNDPIDLAKTETFTNWVFNTCFPYRRFIEDQAGGIYAPLGRPPFQGPVGAVCIRAQQ